MRRLLVAVVALWCLGAAPAAHAISRADARDAAERALRRPLRQDGARLHALARPVARGAIVGQGGRPGRLNRVKRRSWLFWLDQAPGAGFQHPSVLLLIDDRTGRVARRRGLSWWPVVNGRRQFATARGRRVRPPRRRARAAAVPGFVNDCIVTVGDRTDPYLVKSLAAMTALGNRHGLPVAAASSPSRRPLAPMPRGSCACARRSTPWGPTKRVRRSPPPTAVRPPGPAAWW